MIKRLFMLILAFAPLFAAKAQNNPYEIDDKCYAYFRRAEALVNRDPVPADEFRAVTDSLLGRALECGDRKAETIYYVEKLKGFTHSPMDVDASEDVLAAAAKLRQVAKEYGYSQYYYYSYQLSQTYFYNRDRTEDMFEIFQEMQASALRDDDEYGLWMSDRYLISMYIDLDDYVSAQKYLYDAIALYNNSSDATVRRQSITRLYCDLSDTFPVASDSMRINIDRGLEASKQHLDTLRCNFYYAVLAAIDKDRKAYEKARDYCLRDEEMASISKSYPVFFELIQSIFDGDVMDHISKIDQLEKTREAKFIANIAEIWGYKDLAFELEKQLVKKLENKLSELNKKRLFAMEAKLGNNALNFDLSEKESQITKVTRLLMSLMAFVFLCAFAVALWIINNLRKNKKHDAQMISKLTEANERAQAADAAKTRFVQNMSHEVRTPLNAIVGFSQLLSLPDGSFSPEEKDEFAGFIINNTKMLTMLLDDILSANAMDTGNYRIQYEEGECSFMCQAAISSAEHRLQPGVTMTYVPLPEGTFTFRTDPRRVQQILINLLTNACKHTFSGEIKLGCSLDENPGEVTFYVTDTGPGVPAEDAEKIFDRFTKLNNNVQGTGLGLSICRDISARMDGRVYLDTTYTEGGARFVFVVPVEPPVRDNNANE